MWALCLIIWDQESWAIATSYQQPWRTTPHVVQIYVFLIAQSIRIEIGPRKLAKSSDSKLIQQPWFKITHIDTQCKLLTVHVCLMLQRVMTNRNMRKLKFNLTIIILIPRIITIAIKVKPAMVQLQASSIHFLCGKTTMSNIELKNRRHFTIWRLCWQWWQWW